MESGQLSLRPGSRGGQIGSSLISGAVRIRYSMSALSQVQKRICGEFGILGTGTIGMGI